MGRQPLGDEGRTVKATLRITEQERSMLTTAFGSEGKGLRALLDSYRAGWLEHPPVASTSIGPRVHGPVLPATAPLVEPAHERTAHPAIEDDDFPGPRGAEHMYPHDLPLLSEHDVANAVALDQVKQSLPIGPEPVLSPGGLPDRGTEPVGHRHRRDKVIRTEFDRGTTTRVFSCVVPGCPEELR